MTQKIDDIIFIINSKNLEKKSKLRSYFENEKNLVCVAFYPDNQQTLLQMTTDHKEAIEALIQKRKPNYKNT